MPKTTKKQTTKTAAKRSAKATRKPVAAEKRSKPRKTETPVLIGAEVVTKPGVREDISTACPEPMALKVVDVTVPEVKEEVGDVFAAAARVAGSVLAFGSLPLLAPMLIAGPVMSVIGMGASRLFDGPAEMEDERPAVPVLLSVRCDEEGQEQDDLERRAYRDEKGQLHHHTRTYLRDHGNA